MAHSGQRAQALVYPGSKRWWHGAVGSQHARLTSKLIRFPKSKTFSLRDAARLAVASPRRRCGRAARATSFCTRRCSIRGSVGCDTLQDLPSLCRPLDLTRDWPAREKGRALIGLSPFLTLAHLALTRATFTAYLGQLPDPRPAPMLSRLSTVTRQHSVRAFSTAAKRRFFVGGNWKSHGSLSEAQARSLSQPGSASAQLTCPIRTETTVCVEQRHRERRRRGGGRASRGASWHRAGWAAPRLPRGSPGAPPFLDHLRTMIFLVCDRCSLAVSFAYRTVAPMGAALIRVT